MNQLFNKQQLAKSFSRPKPRPREIPGMMNRTEAAYARRLGLLLAGGEIQGWRFQSLKLRLADNTWYTPDFVVFTSIVELHEVKGCKRDGKLLWEDDARVKVKVVAEMYPEFFIRAIGMGPGNMGWIVEDIS